MPRWATVRAATFAPWTYGAAVRDARQHYVFNQAIRASRHDRIFKVFAVNHSPKFNMKLRHLKPEDIPIIEALHQANREKEGLNFATFPDLRDPKQAFALVVEDADGEVIGALVFASVVELISVTSSPEVLAVAMSYENAIRAILKKSGVSRLFSWLPVKHRRSVGKLLRRAGFAETQEITFVTEVR